MPGAEPRASCRSLFRRPEILPVPCQYILSLMPFIIDNPNNLQRVSEVHGLHTRSRNQLFIPNTNLPSIQKCYKAALLGEDDLYFQWIHVVVGIVWSVVQSNQIPYPEKTIPTHTESGVVMGNGACFGSCEQTLEFVAREGYERLR